MKYTNFIIVALLLSTIAVNAQNRNLDDIKSMLARYNSQALHEKIYVRTDKNFYMAGDIAWFSIYNVDGAHHKPADISKVAYVELLDERNRPVLQAKIGLSKGKGDGSFHLPISLNSGNYKLRAYTNWMKNFGAGYFFEKQVTIVNSLKTPAQPSSAPPLVYHAQFFPEGGNLVSNIQSRVAFKVTDQYGKGIEFTGWIINEKNDTLAIFKPLVFGIGHFSFRPDINSRYKALVKTPEGKMMTYELPAVQQHGYVMQVDEFAGDKLRIVVTKNIPISAGIAQANLIIHTRQSVKYAATGIFKYGVAEFFVPKPALGDGISHITVFDDTKEPVCERLYFKQPVQKLNLETSVEKPAYATRQKVNLSVIAKDEKEVLVPSSVTLSVYKMDSLLSIDEESLMSYLWLSADLKGKIESPGYYFTQNGPEALQAMDNLMMTHGWRRFDWQHVLNDKTPAFRFIPELYGHVVKGKVSGDAGKPAAKMPVSLAITGSNSHLYITESNDEGEVSFELPEYYGSGEAIAQAVVEKGNTVRVEITNPFAAEYTTFSVAPFTLAERFQQPLIAQSVSMQVQQAYFSDSLTRFSTPAVDTTPFYGRPDKKYLLDDFTRFNNMEEVMREYVLEVVMIKRDGQPYPHIQKNVEGYLKGDPLVLVDGVPVANKKIATYDPLKVKRLDIMDNTYVLGPMEFDGILNFITYNGNMEGIELDPGAVVMDYEGLQLKREFYSPDYENNDGLSTMPDFRNLLYWSPDIQTGKEGKTKVSFFTSDLAGKFIGIAEGMDENGRAGRKVFVFEVKDLPASF